MRIRSQALLRGSLPLIKSFKVQVNIRVDASKFTRRVSSLVKALGDFKEPLNSADTELRDLYGEKNFDQEGKRIAGSGWSALAASTLKARAKRWGHYKKAPMATGKILTWTGDLRRGFKGVVTKTSLTISNGVKYFRYNQATRKMLKATVEAVDIASKHVIDFIRLKSK